MHQTSNSLYYLEVKNSYSALSKFYGDSYEALVILPKDKERTSYLKVLASIKKNPLALSLKKFKKTNVSFTFPKFTFDFEASLNDILKSLNLQKVFTKEAELGNLLEEEKELYVSKILQKTFLNVDEEGTQAAVVTGISITAKSGSTKLTEFKVDRPFFFFIRHKKKAQILFSAFVQDI